jgi:hypothetical protein
MQHMKLESSLDLGQTLGKIDLKLLESSKIIKEINTIRESPVDYAKTLSSWRKYLRNGFLKIPYKPDIEVSSSCFDSVVKQLNETPALPLLTELAELSKCCNDLVTRLQMHDGLEFPIPPIDKRLSRYGCPIGIFEEIIEYGTNDLDALMLRLLFDNSIRSALLKSKLKYIGIISSELPTSRRPVICLHLCEELELPSKNIPYKPQVTPVTSIFINKPHKRGRSTIPEIDTKLLIESMTARKSTISTGSNSSIGMFKGEDIDTDDCCFKFNRKGNYKGTYNVGPKNSYDDSPSDRWNIK